MIATASGNASANAAIVQDRELARRAITLARATAAGGVTFRRDAGAAARGVGGA